jgi:hypothetical protein
MGAAGRLWVERQWDWDHVARTMRGLLDGDIDGVAVG